MFWKGYFWVRYLEKLVAVCFSPICGFQEKKMKYEIFYKQQEFVYEVISNNKVIVVDDFFQEEYENVLVSKTPNGWLLDLYLIPGHIQQRTLCTHP